QVTDDGAGFDQASVPEVRRGFGLATMRERSDLIGAELEIGSRPGEGTTVAVTVPAPGAEPALGRVLQETTRGRPPTSPTAPAPPCGCASSTTRACAGGLSHASSAPRGTWPWAARPTTGGPAWRWSPSTAPTSCCWTWRCR